MAPRRHLRLGLPLLIVAACGGGGGSPPPDNAMVPPSVQICVPVTPSEAAVMINGKPVDESGCALVREDATVVVEATLEGYAPYRGEFPAAEGGRHITLESETVEEAPPAE